MDLHSCHIGVCAPIRDLRQGSVGHRVHADIDAEAPRILSGFGHSPCIRRVQDIGVIRILRHHHRAFRKVSRGHDKTPPNSGFVHLRDEFGHSIGPGKRFRTLANPAGTGAVARQEREDRGRMNMKVMVHCHRHLRSGCSNSGGRSERRRRRAGKAGVHCRQH
jgi:hypothetical protein